MDSKKIVQDDILRYKTNKWASVLALLGLAFTALYFALLYSVNNNFFYTIKMGFSIIITLVLLLTAFLCSESIKNYRKGYCITLLVLAAFNILRIFDYPLKGLQAKAFDGAVYFWTTMNSGGIFTMLVIYLVLSAACYVGSAVIGYIFAKRLENHEKAVAEGTVDVDAALKELEAEDEAKAAQAAHTEGAVTGEVSDASTSVAVEEDSSSGEEK